LGEFSPNRRFFTLGFFGKKHKRSPNFCAIFC
jgi:hypothetical protein